MEDFLMVGIITSPHGIKGEVKVFATTDDVRRFLELKEVLIDMGEGLQPITLENVRFQKQFAIIKFKGISDPETAEQFRKKNLYVSRANAVKLGRDEYFIADLEGLRVLDEDEKEIGTLSSVLQSAANDVYVISLDDGRELLLPAIKQCVLGINLKAGWIKIHILDGLLD
ncbi:MAG: ribosome maturation factor RimM [Lachnospiraceae bacterium]|jgi:16S rRNA processing protein RimM|nr:ribosome maturation factor RimM [Lachnospiraceae bacterium]